jgi:hypothetical protein
MFARTVFPILAPSARETAHDPLRIVRKPRRRPQPAVVVQAVGNRFLRHGQPLVEFTQAELHFADFADPSVAYDLRRPPETEIAALLRSDLKHRAVLLHRVAELPSFADGKDQRFLNVNILSRLHRRQRDRHMPVIRRDDKDRVDVAPLKHPLILVIRVATLVRPASRFRRVILFGGRLPIFPAFAVNVAHRHHLDSIVPEHRIRVPPHLDAHADQPEVNTIARRILPKHARGHDAREPDRRSGQGNAFQEVATRDRGGNGSSFHLRGWEY